MTSAREHASRLFEHEDRSNLKVLIVKVNGVRPGSIYATCEIVGRPHTKIATEVIKKPLDPVWMHMGELCAYLMGETLEFKVFNDIGARDTRSENSQRVITVKSSASKAGLMTKIRSSKTSATNADLAAAPADELLGRCALECTKFHPEGFDGILTLTDTGLDSPVTLEVKVLVLPVPPPPDDQMRLFVKVLGAKGLPELRGDPFCECQIAGKPAKFVTKLGGYQNRNPAWEEENEIADYKGGDDELDFAILDFTGMPTDDIVGSVTLSGEDFREEGFEGELPLQCAAGNDVAMLHVVIDVYVPPPIDPGRHVTIEDRQPVPFQLRSLDTGRTHRLAAYTQIGRSARQMDPALDLVLSTPGIDDVSRLHAVVKAWPGPDAGTWLVRVYDVAGTSGHGEGPGGGHTGGGTSADGQPVEEHLGTAIEPGSVLRFGLREMWSLERSATFQRSQHAEVAYARARARAEEDPALVREVPVKSVAVYSALQQCTDWISFVRVCLESIGEQDEPPCADAVAVNDECGALVQRHEAATLEAQQAYDIQSLISDVQLGSTCRLRLSADPCLLAPVLEQLELDRQQLAEEKGRDEVHL